MLGGTIWMLAKDHNREWRQWQLDDRDRERWTAEAQLAQAEADSTAKLDDLRNQLAAEQSSKIDAELVRRFQELVEAEDARLSETEIKQAPADFRRLEQSLGATRKCGERQRRSVQSTQGSACASSRDLSARLGGARSTLLNEKKFLAADQTAAVSARGLAVGEGRPTGKIEAQIKELADKIQLVDAAYAEAKDYRIALETIAKRDPGRRAGTREAARCD